MMYTHQCLQTSQLKTMMNPMKQLMNKSNGGKIELPHNY
jgi:hypothetical protein